MWTYSLTRLLVICPSSSSSSSCSVNRLFMPRFIRFFVRWFVGWLVCADERGHAMQQLANMSVEDSRVYIYPRLFALHDMAAECGTPHTHSAHEGATTGTGAEDDDSVVTAGADKIRLPAVVNLSAERLLSEGAFLLEDSQGLFMWLGRYDSMIR